jgi:hypothetical protein
VFSGESDVERECLVRDNPSMKREAIKREQNAQSKFLPVVASMTTFGALQLIPAALAASGIIPNFPFLGSPRL